MPLQRCGNNGWKWGKQGHCYTGPGAKKKAIKQGLAIEGPEKFAAKATEEEIVCLLDSSVGLLDKARVLHELTRIKESDEIKPDSSG